MPRSSTRGRLPAELCILPASNAFLPRRQQANLAAAAHGQPDAEPQGSAQLSSADGHFTRPPLTCQPFCVHTASAGRQHQRPGSRMQCFPGS